MPDETIRIVTSDIPPESPQLVTADGGKTAQPAPQNYTPIEPDIPLKSERGVDYTKLRDLLATKKWQEADEETAKKMLEVAGRTEEGGLRVEDVDRFPCEDLRTIDQLWVKYSNGHFGFSVQKRIYESLGGTREYNEKILEAFGDRVGWRVNGKWLYYKQLKYNKSSPRQAPEGHIPCLVNQPKNMGLWELLSVGRVGLVSSVASRLARLTEESVAVEEGKTEGFINSGAPRFVVKKRIGAMGSDVETGEVEVDF